MKQENEKSVIQSNKSDYVSVILAEQLFGIPVMQVREILNSQNITRIPLAPKEIAGSLNLRGRIVTAVNLHSRLNLPLNLAGHPCINVVVESQGELYSLMIDEVLDVIQLSSDEIETNPQTLDQVWREISAGVVKRDKQLMIIMDVEALLSFDEPLGSI